MKKILIPFCLVLTISSALQAQDIDRSKAPKPGPAPVINIADPETFTLPNGLKVFVMRNTKLPMVSATLIMDTDPIMEGNKAGAADMAGSVMRRGAAGMNKAQLDEAVDFLGGSLGTSATSANASALKENFPALMKLMADVVLHPSFEGAELEKVRTQTLNALAQAKDDPNTIAKNVRKVLLFGENHPYGEITTDETVKNVTTADIKTFHSTYWRPNIGYLVFVGDITGTEAKKIAETNFGAWQKGEVPKHQFPAINPPAKTYVAVVNRPASVQSVISIGAPVVLKPGAPDAIPASVMNEMLGGGFSSRLNQNLREKHAFTYGAGSGLNSDKLVGSFVAGAQVRNEKTDSAIGQFLYEFNRIQDKPAVDSELTAQINYMSGGFARSLESPSTMANFALNTARYNLPKDYYRNYLTRLAATKPGDVMTMAKKYLTDDHAVIVVVGNAKEIAPGLEKYGEVKYFDLYGHPAAAAKAVAGGTTPKSVLEKAVAAYGGQALLSTVKDVIMSGKVAVMGQELDFVQKTILPDGFSQEVLMGSMSLMKQMKKGDDYSMTAQGASQPMDDKAKEDMDARAAFFEELLLLKNPAYKMEIKGIEQVEGKDAVVLDITGPSGSHVTSYYDVASGLKVQDVRTQEMGPGQTMSVTSSFLDYKDFNGVKIPAKIIIDMGQMKQEVSITDVKMNTGLKLTDL